MKTNDYLKQVEKTKQTIKKLNLTCKEDNEIVLEKEYTFLYQNKLYESKPIKIKDKLYFSIDGLLNVRVNSVLSK